MFRIHQSLAAFSSFTPATQAFEDRLANFENDDLGKYLRDCVPLKNILKQIIQSTDAYPALSETFAHFLMGKKDARWLPPDFQNTWNNLNQIPPHIQNMLSDLLRSSKHNVLLEPTQKTKMKLEVLNRYVNNIEHHNPPKDIQYLFLKWKPENRFIISLDDNDKVIRTAAKVKAIDHQVPENNCFSVNGDNYRVTTGRNPSGHMDITASLNITVLERLTYADRLDIVAHANTESFGHHSPAQLAQFLKNRGLKQIGVLKLEGCNIGVGNYLEDLKRELTRQGIEVGYLCGPTGYSSDTREVVKTCGGGRGTFNINLPLIILFPPMWPLAFSSKMVNFIPEKFMLKVVKGNVDIAFPGTRYDIRLTRNIGMPRQF